MTLEEKRKKKKKSYNSITYTTGDPVLNMDFFNKINGTDFENQITKEVNNTNDIIDNESAGDSEGGTENAGSEGGMAEAIQVNEAKRETRRYYIRPQNIFCANKAEVLKAFIDIGDANCSVYTLKHLGPSKDISKLTNKDIIYYYDDGILYDKNHIKVMDYDLYIKNEEKRKRFTGDPEKISDTSFNKEYKDRITDRNSELVETINTESDTFKDRLQAVIEDGEEVYLGSNQDDQDSIFVVDGEQYSNTEYYAGKDSDQYYITTYYISHHGGSEEGENLTFKTFEDLYQYIISKELRDGDIINDSKEDLEEEAFNLNFTDINAFDEAIHTKNTCCICGEEFEGYGNNPQPYKNEGRCCDACNLKFVIPARLAEYTDNYSWPGLENSEEAED